MKLPPRWADKFLEWYCNPNLIEDLQGDLHERFYSRVQKHGRFIASFLFIIDVFSFLKPYMVARPKTIGFRMMMFSGLRFSFRSLWRHRFFSAMHIIGLTLGITLTLVIFLFITYELSFDKWNSKASEIFRINSRWTVSGDQEFKLYASPPPLADVVRREVPEITEVASVFPQYKATIAAGPSNVFSQRDVLIAEASFLKIFDVDVVSGDKQALHQPYQAIVSESTAIKLFGSVNPIGKSFKYRNKFDINVAGVFRDLPGNSSLPASVIMSYVDNPSFTGNGDTWYFGGGEWTTVNAVTYASVEPKTNVVNIQRKLDRIADRYINSLEENDGISCSFFIQPLLNIHFDTSGFGGGPWVPSIDSSWLYIFGATGILVLCLACVNFVNLSTAQTIIRSKEVGIRKTIGAAKNQIVVQFLMEPAILIFVASIAAVLAASFIVPPVNQLLGKHLEISGILTPRLVISTLTALLATGLAAGLYPALLASRSNVIASLKPGASSQNYSTISILRKGLVIFQFTMSAVLLTIVFTTTEQTRFINSKYLGFRKEGIIVVNLPDKTGRQSFVDKVSQLSGVIETSLSRTAPLSNDHWWNTIGKNDITEVETVCFISADDKFFNLYGLKILSGRVPSPQDTLDEIHKVVVNEKLIKVLELGSAEQAIGKRFSWSGTAEISAVVADFNVERLRYGMVPILIHNEPNLNTSASIRVQDVNSEEMRGRIEAVWKNEFPSQAYEPFILEQEIESYYKTEADTYTMFTIFAGLAVLISCLGLLGLCSFATFRRTKEISIRKILGASVGSILVMLSSQFLKLVGTGCVVALPLAWLSIDFILGFYAYKIDVTWTLFALPISFLILISVATMVTQTIKASVADPVKNLKSE